VEFSLVGIDPVVEAASEIMLAPVLAIQTGGSMRALRDKLTYANVLSTLCLFLVLGGGAAFAAGQLAPRSVGTRQLKNAAVTGPKIKRASIEATKLTALAVSTLKGPKGAKGSTGARGATGAKGERGATGPQGAQGPAGTIAAPEPLRVVGASGQPPFGSGWDNLDAATRPPAAFYLDRQDVVHLQGEVTRLTGTGSQIFVLPAGYGPELQQTFATVGNGDTFAAIKVEPNGEVALVAGDPGVLHLNGITWRAGK
jgi:Collagen triple helix repeat (20 copies)